MDRTHAPARDYRRITFYLLALGAMTVSIGGQVETLRPSIGFAFACLFAVVNDGCAIRALDAAMSAPKGSSIKRWAWVAVLLAASSGATLNYWHAVFGVPASSPVRYPVLLGLIAGVQPTVLVLVLSHIIGLETEQRRARDSADDRELAPPTASDCAVTPARPRETTAGTASLTASSTASLVATTGAPDRELAPAPTTSTASSRRRAAATESPHAPAPLPRLHVAPPPDADRPEWMTDAQIGAVLKSAREAGAPTRRYGEPRLRAEHPTLLDGSRMTSHKAQELLRFIRDHDLLRAAS